MRNIRVVRPLLVLTRFDEHLFNVSVHTLPGFWVGTNLCTHDAVSAASSLFVDEQTNTSIRLVR